MSARDTLDAIRARLEGAMGKPLDVTIHAARPMVTIQTSTEVWELIRGALSTDLAAMHAALTAVEEALEKVSTWRPYDTRDIGDAFPVDTVHDLVDDIRALVDAALQPKGDPS